MDKQDTAADAEFSAMHTVYSALKPLDEEARNRVISYIVARLDIAAPRMKTKIEKPMDEDTEEQEAPAEGAAGIVPLYKAFAELFDAAQPQTASQKALVAGYWLQICQGADSFDSQSLNKELKNLGHGIANITAAIEGLKIQSPALALQLKKSGSSQQARKTYKITVAGENAVRAMING